MLNTIKTLLAQKNKKEATESVRRHFMCDSGDIWLKMRAEDLNLYRSEVEATEHNWATSGAVKLRSVVEAGEPLRGYTTFNIHTIYIIGKNDPNEATLSAFNS